MTDASILEHIARLPHARATFKQLVRELGPRVASRDELEQALDRLIDRGQLIEVRSGHFVVARFSREYAVGRLNMHRDGYGFLIPDHPIEGLRGDVYIPRESAQAAMHGDRVVVRIARIEKDGRADGEIVKVLRRAHQTVVGEFRIRKRGNFVEPHDEKIRQWIQIPAGMEVPPAAVNRDRVGVAPVVVQSPEDLDGMVVNAEILEFAEGGGYAVGRVIEILGRPDDFGVDVEIMIRKFHLPHHFPAATLEEAQEAPVTISADELTRRRDFRELPIVTIDGETARDFDDAVLVHMLPNGNFELQVHIADVAQYVTPGSALDQEARLRGTSVYFPDRAVPMLPLELSTDICSLRPQVERLVLSCVMEMDHHGEIVGYELCEGVIRSAERMTYTAVNAVLENDAAMRERYAPLVPKFQLMRDLALILNKKRQRRGSIDFDLPEPVIEFDELGLMKSIGRSERNIANRLIEEFMLSANECVAQHLQSKGIASLYRVHEKPDAKRVYDFEVIAATFGYSLGVGALPIHRVQMKADRRAAYGTGKRVHEIEIPKEVHITPRMYQKLTEKIAGKPEERILSYLMLRSLKQARYSEENLGHFALAATSYTHFTSPIRRYPDLIVHRILKSVLRSEGGTAAGLRAAGPPGSAVPTQDEPASPWSKRRTRLSVPQEALVGPIGVEELHAIAEESSQAERRADEAERELMEWKKVKFMQDRVGELFDGLVTSVTKFGFFVELADLFVEGLVPLNTLTDDRYTYHENTREIIGQRSGKIYHLGQKIRVLVDRIDPVEKKIQFAVVEDEPVQSAGKKKKRR